MTKEDWKKKYVKEIDAELVNNLYKYHGLTPQRVTEEIDKIVDSLWEDFKENNKELFPSPDKVGDLEIPSFIK